MYVFMSCTCSLGKQNHFEFQCHMYPSLITAYMLPVISSQYHALKYDGTIVNSGKRLGKPVNFKEARNRLRFMLKDKNYIIAMLLLVSCINILEHLPYIVRFCVGLGTITSRWE